MKGFIEVTSAKDLKKTMLNIDYIAGAKAFSSARTAGKCLINIAVPESNTLGHSLCCTTETYEEVKTLIQNAL